MAEKPTDKDPTAQPPARFETFRRRASQLMDSPDRVRGLLAQGVAKLASSGSSQLSELRQQLTLGIALLRAWLAGDYRQVSEKTVVVLLAALLYFVVPIDVIPDFLLGWGYLDDVAVVSYVFSQVADEIAAFAQWQQSQAADAEDLQQSEQPADLPPVMRPEDKA